MDINILAGDILKRTGVRVIYNYPEEEMSLPCISYSTLSEKGIMSADNTELLKEAKIIVNVWARTMKECSDILRDATVLLEADNWACEIARDGKKDERGVYLREGIFTKIIMI